MFDARARRFLAYPRAGGGQFAPEHNYGSRRIELSHQARLVILAGDKAVIIPDGEPVAAQNLRQMSRRRSPLALVGNEDFRQSRLRCIQDAIPIA